MKYEVLHTHIQSMKQDKGGDPARATPVAFKQGDVLTPAQLEDAGFDVDFLERNGAIEKLKGSRTAEDDAPPEPPTTSQDATPGMGQPPEGPGKPTADDKKVGETGRKK